MEPVLAGGGIKDKKMKMKNKLRKVQFKYLDYSFENICAVRSKYYPDSIFFKKGDKVILELRPSGTLWVLRQIWNNISDMLSLDYDETQQIIKEWVEKQLKLEEIIPNCYNNSGLKEVEEELKSVEVTPVLLDKEAFVSVEIIPLTWGGRNWKKLESRLKSEEITPFDTNAIIQHKWNNL